MRLKRSYGSHISFNDLLFNTLLGFVYLFAIAVLLISPVTEKKLSPKAEFIITVTWPGESKDDVDTWLEDPLGNLLFFLKKETGLMHLDKDDLGASNDTVTLPNGKQIKIKINQEIVTIRGFIPGEWVLNVHMYRKRDIIGNDIYEGGNPTPVEVKVVRLNPKVRIVVYETVILITNWQEETVTRFTMAADGDILSMDDLPKKLVRDVNSAGPAGGL